MNPVQNTEKVSKQQTILAIVFLLIIVGFILYLFLFIRGEQSISEDVETRELTREERLEMLKELEENSQPSPPKEDRLEMLELLEQVSEETELTAEERLQRLKDLEEGQSVDNVNINDE